MTKVNNEEEPKARRMLLTLVSTGTATLVLFLINLLLTPYITKKLGVEAYGFISLANTFVSYAMIIMTALNSFATRYIAIEYHRQNYEKASGYFSSLFYSNIIMSAFVFLVSLPLVVSPSSFLDVPKALTYEITFLFLLVFCNFLITNANASFTSAAYIKNRLDVYGVFQTVAYVVEAIVLLVAYSALPAALWYYGVSLIAAGLVLFSGNLFIYKRYAPELILSRSLFSIALVKELMQVGIWSSINSLGNVLNNGLGLLVSNVLLSATAMGELAISRVFISAYSRLYQLVSQAFYPLILKSYSDEDEVKLLEYFKVAMACTGSIASVLFSGFCVLCPVFYSLWIPEQNIQVLFPLTILAMLYSLVEGPIQPLYYVYALTLKNRFPTVVTVFGGFVNVLITIPLILFTNLGVYAIPLTSFSVFSVISFVTNPIYSARCLGLRWTTFYPQIARVLLSCIICCLAFEFINIIFVPADWLQLSLSIVACLIVGSVICLVICFDSGSKRIFVDRVKQRIM